MPTVNISELPAMKGTEIGVSDWIEISQERINHFADCTDDHQFIHVNEELAALTPFGSTIAHGFLTMSMLSKFSYDTALRLEGAVMGINYGFEKGRFLNPVRAGKKIRARFVLADVQEKKPEHWMLTYDVTVEIDGETKPAMAMQWLTMQVVKAKG